MSGKRAIDFFYKAASVGHGEDQGRLDLEDVVCRAVGAQKDSALPQ